MIEWIKQIYYGVTNFVEQIGNLITNVVDKIKEFLSFVQAAFEFVTGAFALIPTYYVVFGGIIITVLIVFLIVGREPGGDA